MSRIEEMERLKKEKAAEKRRLEYVTPEWTSKRAKPVFDPSIWPDKETVDVLAEYTDFHALNPHSVTPRPLDDVLVVAGKDLKLASPRLQLKVYTSEADVEAIQETGKPRKAGQELVTYSQTGAQPPQPLSPDYTTPFLGIHGTFARVASISAEFERKSANAGRYDNEDVWYKMSVKDGLETYVCVLCVLCVLCVIHLCIYMCAFAPFFLCLPHSLKLTPPLPLHPSTSVATTSTAITLPSA